MIINHNMNALNAHRNMNVNNTAAGKSMEKLSSGLRINRAGDDAAGLAISEKMRGQIRGLTQASRNASDGISMIQTAEGALNETQNILQRMRELSVQSSNDTNTAADRQSIQKEIEQLTEEIDRIGNNTEFNTQSLLKGDGSVALEKTGSLDNKNAVGAEAKTQATATIQVTNAAKANDKISLSIGGKEIGINFDKDITAVNDVASDIKTKLEEAIKNDDDLNGNFNVTVLNDKVTITATQDGAFDGDKGSISAATKTGTVAVTSTAGVGTTTHEAAKIDNVDILQGVAQNVSKENALKSVEDLIGKGFEINGEKIEFYNVNDGTYKGDAIGVDISKVIDAAKNVANANLGAQDPTNIKNALASSIIDQVGDKLDGVKITKGTTNGTVQFESIKKGVDAKLELKDGATKEDFTATFQVGANSNQTISISIGDMRADALGVKNVDLTTAENSQKATSTIQAAIEKVSTERAGLGAVQNRLEYTISNLDNTTENLTSAESTLRDVDMAKEMMTFSKNNILNQAAQAMLAQANQQPQNVLSLLR